MLSEPFLAPISTSTGPTSSSAMPTHLAHVNGLRTSTQRISTATTAVLQFQMSEKVAGSILDNTITAQLSDTVYSAAGMAYLSPPPPRTPRSSRRRWRWSGAAALCCTSFGSPWLPIRRRGPSASCVVSQPLVAVWQRRFGFADTTRELGATQLLRIRR